jgi:hypothetical protein
VLRNLFTIWNPATPANDWTPCTGNLWRGIAAASLTLLSHLPKTQ